MPDIVEVERTIAATPHRLYEPVSDLTRMGEWSPENTGGRWLADESGTSTVEQTLAGLAAAERG